MESTDSLSLRARRKLHNEAKARRREAERKERYGELRDRFAMASIAGLLEGNQNRVWAPEEIAKDAYEIADAMMKLRVIKG